MSSDFLEQVPLGLVDLVALRTAHRNLLVQLLQIGCIDVRNLLHNLHDHLELGPQNLVRLTTQRSERRLKETWIINSFPSLPSIPSFYSPHSHHAVRAPGTLAESQS